MTTSTPPNGRDNRQGKNTVSVLVVDDEPGMAAMVELMLEGHSYEVIGVGDPSTAKSLVDRGVVDLMLLDEMLRNGQHGTDFLAELSKNHADIPVIIITAESNNVETGMKAAKLGAEDCFSKPLNKDRLLKVLGKLRERVLSRRRRVDTRVYNNGNGANGTELMEIEALQKKLREKGLLDRDKQVAHLYSVLARILEHEPEGIVFDKDGMIHLSVEDTAEVIDLSPVRIQALVAENRVQAIRPSGHDLFISLSSALLYKTEGRMRPWGRRRVRS